MEFLLLAIGFLLLIKGADFLIDSSSNLARILGISPFIIGLTVVAFGTSAPEAVIGLISGIKAENTVTLGNVIGSCLMNISLSLGLTALIWKLDINKKSYNREIPVCIGIQLLLTAYIIIFNIASFILGILLLVMFVLFMYFTFVKSKNEKLLKTQFEEETEKEEKEIHTKKYIFTQVGLLLLGLFGLTVGGNLVVDNSVIIAKNFNMSTELIGLTVVSLGTTLPEFITSIVAAMRKEPDIVFGNIIGSNIFNMLFVLGLSVVINPIAIASDLYIDAIVMTGSTILLVLFTFKTKKLSRFNGFFLLLYYLIFLGYKIYIQFFI